MLQRWMQTATTATVSTLERPLQQRAGALRILSLRHWVGGRVQPTSGTCASFTMFVYLQGRQVLRVGPGLDRLGAWGDDTFGFSLGQWKGRRTLPGGNPSQAHTPLLHDLRHVGEKSVPGSPAPVLLPSHTVPLEPWPDSLSSRHSRTRGKPAEVK